MTAKAHPELPPSGPLSGLKVLEMGQLIAGPFCGQLLGDMGAEVIKIEPPGAGDPMRVWGQGEPVWWEVIARNKLSVSIDLRTPEGQQLARELALQADVLIENFRPGTLEGWGLGPEGLLRDNPQLIVARMSGYGQTGPYAERPGFGGIAEAMGGWRRIVGEPGRPPARLGVSIGDSLTATYGCLGVLAALHHRNHSGEGQVVDAALYESVLQVMEGLIAEYAVSGITRERSGAILPGIAPSNVYPCRDGELMIAANNDQIFRRFCAAMGRPELGEDPRFANHRSRGRRQAELDQLIGDWTSAQTVKAVEDVLIAASVPCGRLFTARDMLSDPHFAARGAVQAIAHPRWGRLAMQAVFPKLSRTPGSIRMIAPQSIGQHTDAILESRLGLSTSRLRALRARGVI